MSAISALAQTFEQNAKQQASDTTKAVESALKQHESHLQKVLQLSELTLSAAIQLHESSLNEQIKQSGRITSRLVLKSWAWIALSIALVMSASFGALWWTSQQIASNLEALSEQKKALALAPRGVEFSSDKNGQFIILPPRTSLKAGWTHENGKRQAYKLEFK